MRWADSLSLTGEASVQCAQMKKLSVQADKKDASRVCQLKLCVRYDQVAQ